MPQPKRQKLEPDRVVEALVPDPAAGPPDATILRGFLGRSPEDGVWRLFVTAALDEYVDIPEDAILHSEKLPDDGGTVLWVRKTLELTYSRVQSQRVQAEFLGGPVTAAARAAAPQAAPQPAPSLGIACPSVVVVCTSTTLGCQSNFGPCVTFPAWRCPSLIKPCGSWNILCQSITGPRCTSHLQIQCGSWVDACPSVWGPCISNTPTTCPSGFVCPSTAVCPSELGCPSEICNPGGGGFGPIG